MNETEGRPQRPEIDDQIRRRAEAISLFMGGDYNMTVGVGEWGSGWHWDFIKNHVNMDAKDLATESMDVVSGVAAHEGNHRAVSRTDSVMDMWQKPGFSFGYNAVEDPRANEGGMKFMPGSRKWIKSYIERDLGPGGGLDYQGMEKAAKEKIGYVPDFMKWGAEMIRYWHEKELAGVPDTPESRKDFLKGIPDANVRAIVEQTLPDFEKYYKTLPSSKDEMEVRKSANEASQNFKKNIWPIYEKLVEKSMNDQSMANMVKDMMQQDQQGQRGQGGQPMEVPFSSLPKEVQDEIKKKVEEAEKEAEKQAQKDKQGQQGKSGDQEGSSEGQGDKGKIPWDQLSEKAKEAAKKAFDSLPKDKKERYKASAQKDLEDVEDEANEKLRGKMNDPRSNETHKEKEEREAREESREQEKSERSETREEMRQREQKTQKLLENLPENPYFEISMLPDVSAITRKMERELKPVFQPTESPEKRYTSSGLKPNMKKAVQMEADPRRTNIFESKGRPSERAFRFLFLLDLSGSMSGEKILETFKSLIPIEENLNKFGIESAVVGYSDNIRGIIKVYKPFELKKLDRDSRDKMGQLLSDGGGGTPSLEATKRAYAMLLRRINQVQGSRNYLIPLTDGAPTDCDPEEMSKYIAGIRRNKEVVTAGFGIGPGTAYVNESYPLLPNEVRVAIGRKLGKNPDKVGNSFRSASEFGDVFAIIAGYMVRRPELFFK